MNRIGWAGILAVVLAGLGGCGGDSAPKDPTRQDDELAVRRVLAAALDALYDGDGPRACSLYTRSYRQELVKENQADRSDVAPKGATCEEQVKSFQPILRRSVARRDVKVIRVRVSGDKATALTRFSTTRGTSRVKDFLVRRDGKWKIHHDQEPGEPPP